MGIMEDVSIIPQPAGGSSPKTSCVLCGYSSSPCTVKLYYFFLRLTYWYVTETGKVDLTMNLVERKSARGITAGGGISSGYVIYFTENYYI